MVAEADKSQKQFGLKLDKFIHKMVPKIHTKTNDSFFYWMKVLFSWFFGRIRTFYRRKMISFEKKICPSNNIRYHLEGCPFNSSSFQYVGSERALITFQQIWNFSSGGLEANFRAFCKLFKYFSAFDLLWES
jgi:hypothetical protein